MYLLDYRKPNIQRFRLRRHYAIYIALFGLLHFAGTVLFLIRGFIYLGDDPHPVFERLFFLFELPMVSFRAPRGYAMMSGVGTFVSFGIVNALLWGMVGSAVCHIVLLVLRKLARQRGRSGE
jgi:hypothetical protein